MSAFTSIVSKFAHETQGESSRSSTNSTIDKKRPIKSEDEEHDSPNQELSTQVRKSLRLSTTRQTGPLVSRVISAESIKARPHHKRIVAEVEKKEETTVTRPRLGQGGRRSEYAPPEVYAHLNFVPDIIDYDLDVLFVGINPGVKSSQRIRHFAGPTNHFWPCLSESGLAPPGVRLGPADDQSLPALCNMGLTNLVDRPSRTGNELSEAECRAAAPILTAKIKKYRPRFVCFVSKHAWEMYTGVGLGLQTAWVSWYDEPEDQDLAGFKQGNEIRHDREQSIQNNLDTHGYRLATYFEEGPSVEQLKRDVSVEGVSYTLPGEFSESKSTGPEPKKPVKMELDEKYDIKAEQGQAEKIKMELDEDIRIKPEQDQDRKVEPNQQQDVKIKMECDKDDIRVEQQDTKFKIEPEDRTELDSRNDTNVEQDWQDTKTKADPIKEERLNGQRTNTTWESRSRGGVRGSRMFVMPSTSGRVTQYTKEDKLAYFKQLAELVRRDRQMRGVKAPWES
ncbi:hypothetical protein B0O80DRAFT_496267 [Mortierella sp. GBAus27b]|nr:hypothetical protein BGX31_006400 [Mortierella sp. GBA43]KAI8357508.1 hypothetical protein B0O80DRAFT_496267 [Mortierella sp. GBAus27b]